MLKHCTGAQIAQLGLDEGTQVSGSTVLDAEHGVQIIVVRGGARGHHPARRARARLRRDRRTDGEAERRRRADGDDAGDQAAGGRDASAGAGRGCVTRVRVPPTCRRGCHVHDDSLLEHHFAAGDLSLNILVPGKVVGAETAWEYAKSDAPTQGQKNPGVAHSSGLRRP